MRRIFDSYAYGEGPRAGCWWDQTCALPARPTLTQDTSVDVAIIGGGFTGISAALHLARDGVRVALFEAERIGWGASGRNGGFCCLGGGMAEDAQLDRHFGKVGRVAYRRGELAAIRLVETLIQTHGLEVDRHSDGETSLAHRPGDLDDLRAHGATIRENYDVAHQVLGPDALAGEGMGGPFHGALTIRAGFGLNPRKYVAGIAQAAEAAGAALYEQSAVSRIAQRGGGWALSVDGHTVKADKVILATNGYSSEDLPPWLAGRYMPGQSNVIVTRPLTDAELSAQGWTSDQMAYDTRNLLHYFRLMPDRRFLFGMRGGLLTGAAAEARARRRIRADFDRMFPAWRGVETPFAWSGMVSLARGLLPFVGPVPGQAGLFAGMCYHGNGVAMGSYAGALLADLAQGNRPERLYPDAMQRPLRRFELGRFRRAIMPGVYAGLMIADR